MESWKELGCVSSMVIPGCVLSMVIPGCALSMVIPSIQDTLARAGSSVQVIIG